MIYSNSYGYDVVMIYSNSDATIMLIFQGDG